MRTTRAQPSDWPVLNRLYRRNHPADSRGLPRRRWWTQTFVMKDDGNDDAILGFTIATYAGTRAHRHGAIRMLEIEPDLEAGELLQPLVVRGLNNICVRWMAARGCTSAVVPALSRPEYAWVLPELGASTGLRGLTIPITPRAPEWQWVLDPETGMLHPEAGPEGTPPGPPPLAVQAARQVWA